MTYFVIHVSDNGASISSMCKEELEQSLVEGYWGGSNEVFNKMPCSDISEWPEGMLIIRGDVVVPRVVEVATKYEL